MRRRGGASAWRERPALRAAAPARACGCRAARRGRSPAATKAGFMSGQSCLCADTQTAAANDISRRRRQYLLRHCHIQNRYPPHECISLHQPAPARPTRAQHKPWAVGRRQRHKLHAYRLWPRMQELSNPACRLRHMYLHKGDQLHSRQSRTRTSCSLTARVTQPRARPCARVPGTLCACAALRVHPGRRRAAHILYITHKAAH